MSQPTVRAESIKSTSILYFGNLRLNCYCVDRWNPIHSWFWWKYKWISCEEFKQFILSRPVALHLFYTFEQPAFRPMTDYDPVLLSFGWQDGDVNFHRSYFKMGWAEFYREFFSVYQRSSCKPPRSPIIDKIYWKTEGF